MKRPVLAFREARARWRARKGDTPVLTGRDYLKWISAACALAATATAEYDIARAIGMNEFVAVAVPGALDAYVLRALRAHKEVLTAVLAMVGVNAASHLVAAGIIPVGWETITAVSAIAPLVLWRVHALSTPGGWRRAKLWGTSTADVLAEHGGEHDKAPDNPEPPGTREHPHVGEHVPSTACVWGHAECADAETCTVYQGTPSTDDDLDVPDPGVLGSWADAAYIPPSAAAWGEGYTKAPPAPDWLNAEHKSTPSTDDADLDVPGFMKPGTPEHSSVLAPPVPVPVPVHAPYVDHVSTRTPAVLHAVPDLPPLPGTFTRRRTDTSTGDAHNLGHVSTGVLLPSDTAHMDAARVLYTDTGRVPTLRAMKDHTSTGTDRARRLVAAIAVEHEESTS